MPLFCMVASAAPTAFDAGRRDRKIPQSGTGSVAQTALRNDADCAVSRPLTIRPAGDIQHSRKWFTHFAASCLEAGEAALFETRRGVLFPMRAARRWLGPAPARLLTSLTNYYSTSFALPGLEECDDPEGVVEAWAREHRSGAFPADRIGFEALDPDRKGFAALKTGLARAGYWIETYPYFLNRYLSLEGLSFDGYWAGRDPKLRNTVDRKAKALLRQFGATIERYVSARHAGEAIQHYQQVYGRSWKSAEPFAEFIPGLIATALTAGSGEVAILKAAGQPVAAQIWLYGGRTATIFKLAHDEAWDRFSPGSVLTRHMMEAAFRSERFAEIDFGRGDDSYKKLWLPEARWRWGIAAYQPRRIGGAYLAARNLLPRLVRRQGAS